MLCLSAYVSVQVCLCLCTCARGSQMHMRFSFTHSCCTFWGCFFLFCCLFVFVSSGAYPADVTLSGRARMPSAAFDSRSERIPAFQAPDGPPPGAYDVNPQWVHPGNNALGVRHDGFNGSAPRFPPPSIAATAAANVGPGLYNATPLSQVSNAVKASFSSTGNRFQGSCSHQPRLVLVMLVFCAWIVWGSDSWYSSTVWLNGLLVVLC